MSGEYSRVFVEPSAYPKDDMLSVAKTVDDFNQFSSIEMTDVNGNTMELDTQMKHVIANIVKGQFSFADLPSNYKTYTVFVGADVATTSDDVDAIASLRWAEHILIVFKQSSNEAFSSRFDELIGMGKLKNVCVTAL